MFNKGPVFDRKVDEFGLIETLLWSPEDGFFLFEEHLSRLSTSCAAFGFFYDAAQIKQSLEDSIQPSCGEMLRVRLLLSRHGDIEISVTPITPISPDCCWRVVLAPTRFCSTDPLLRHKTSRRSLYENTLAEAQLKYCADEVLFLNERDEICESARCNLFVPKDRFLLTPALSCGLLPGTLRSHLLTGGQAREALIRRDDLQDEFFLGNSVRGLVRAKMLT